MVSENIKERSHVHDKSGYFESAGKYLNTSLCSNTNVACTQENFVKRNGAKQIKSKRKKRGLEEELQASPYSWDICCQFTFSSEIHENVCRFGLGSPAPRPNRHEGSPSSCRPGTESKAG